MKKIITRLLWFTPIILLLVAINYFVDPANLFKSSGYEKGIANLLLNGSNVGGLENFDDRLTLKFFIEGLSKKKNVVVIGSSRSMQIDSESVGQDSFYNSSVPGASLEDFYAIYGLYKKQGLTPPEIILGIDPWILNKDSGETRWKSIADSYYFAINSQPNQLLIRRYYIDNLIDKATQLFSPSYFQNSVTLLLNDLKNHKKGGGYYPTGAKDGEDTMIKHSDGSIIYAKEFEELGSLRVDNLARDFTKGKQLYQIGIFTRFDSEYLNLFENFIQELKSENIKVIFFLPPYHPIVYEYMLNSQKYKMVFETQKYLENYAKNNGIGVIGSYNPYELGLKNADFQDGQHLKSYALKKIIKQQKL